MTLLKKVTAVGLGLALLGILLSGLGWLLGGNLRPVYYSDGQWHIDETEFWGTWPPLRSSSMEQGFKDIPFDEKTLSSFYKVDAEVGPANFVLQQGEAFSISTSGIDERYFSQEVNNGELKIKYRKPHKKLVTLPKGHIVVTVPFENHLEEVSIEDVIGTGEIRDITCDALEVAAAVGTMTIADVTTNSLEVQGGVGETVGTNLTVLQKLSVENGVGNVVLQGDMRGKIRVESGVGEVELFFTGAVEEYYSLSQPNHGIGSVTVNDEAYSKAAFSPYPTENQIVLTNGVGDIRLSFNKEGQGNTSMKTADGFTKTQSVIIRAGDDSSSYVHITDPQQLAQLFSVLSDPAHWELEPLPQYEVFQVCTVEFYQTPTPTVLEGASTQEELLLTATLYLEPDEDYNPEDNNWYLSFSGIMGGTFEIPRSTGEYLRGLKP